MGSHQWPMLSPMTEQIHPPKLLGTSTQASCLSEGLRRRAIKPTFEKRLVRQMRRLRIPGTDETGTHATVDLPQEQRLLRAPLLPERPSRSIASYFALQEWEGYVTNVGAETFAAELVDMTRFANGASEHAEIPLDEIGSEERRELKVGSIFRWTIGYETLPSGQRRRVSQVVFRQLPRWSKADIDAANRLGRHRYRQIKWE